MCQCQGHSCCGSSCGCQSKGCSCSCHKTGMAGSCHSSCGCGCQGQQGKQGGCDYAAKFLELADQAWMEVLKEKIKEHIKASGKNMDELARIISEANHERWQKKMENNQCSGGYEEKLREFFHMSCPSKGGNKK